MKVYKVVKFTNKEGVYKSAWVKNPELILWFKLGEITKPRIGNIFAFKTEEQAEAWKYRMLCHYNVILEGVGVSRMTINSSLDIPIINSEYPNFYWSLERVAAYWAGNRSPESPRFGADCTPCGTVLMRTFRPLRIISISPAVFR